MNGAQKPRLKGLDEMPLARRTLRQSYFAIHASFYRMPQGARSALKLGALLLVVWGAAQLAGVPIEKRVLGWFRRI
jgi:hypothetical protein